MYINSVEISIKFNVQNTFTCTLTGSDSIASVVAQLLISNDSKIPPMLKSYISSIQKKQVNKRVFTKSLKTYTVIRYNKNRTKNRKRIN